MTRRFGVWVALLWVAGCEPAGKASAARDEAAPSGAARAAAPAASASPWDEPNAPAGAWESAEVAVSRRAGALSCAAKTHGNWVRVTCRGAAEQTLPQLEMRKGRVGDLIEEGETGFTYLWIEGQDLAVGFALGTDKLTYRAAWPTGAPRPEVVGVFESGS